jgi:hypothetical protein
VVALLVSGIIDQPSFSSVDIVGFVFMFILMNSK